MSGWKRRNAATDRGAKKGSDATCQQGSCGATSYV